MAGHLILKLRTKSFVTFKYNDGYDIHNGHPLTHIASTILIPTRLLDNEEEETAQQVVESKCNKAAGRN